MKFNTSEKQKFSRTKPKAKTLAVRYDELKIKSQKLYEVYDSIGYENLVQKLENSEEIYQKLNQSNKILRESNKMAFFFLNFYKDFESKLIYAQGLDNKKMIEICQNLHNEYSSSMLNFDMEQYERIIEENTHLLKSYDPEKGFNELKTKIENLNNEFIEHRNKDSDTIRDISVITPKD